MCQNSAKLSEHSHHIASTASIQVSPLKTLLSTRKKMTDCEFGYIYRLAQDYLQYVLQIPQPGSGPSKASRVLQKVAFSVQKEVEKNLKPCLDNVNVVSVDTARTLFNQVMEKEFEDGIINWGRIVTIFAFEGILIKKLLRQQIAPDVDTYKEISYFVAEFVMNNTGEWIKQNGGWGKWHNHTPMLVESVAHKKSLSLLNY
ncbi:bcl-2-related protein A1 isoform X2 [Pongo pygmaeus]|uniref:bcl-2-related protein A1 isoform X2 n=1 Tax=Pongo pygmaeus TaxID=9600 RepID=UPI0023E0BF07|nr:bcl-2-related protein A1 isoform X2 [Pongo pygmaeus]